VLGRPDLATDERFNSNSRRVTARDAMDAIITAAFASLTAAEVITRLEGAGIANARMNTVHEFLVHPQLDARDRWRTVGSPVGPIRAVAPPFNIDGVESPMGPIPAVGEHTDAILGELGFSAGTIAEWRRAGIV
jgi:crotonobetainyl-CoA:carnitine CoA-transferase CaiB-like acyl-CoA transferase